MLSQTFLYDFLEGDENLYLAGTTKWWKIRAHLDARYVPIQIEKGNHIMLFLSTN